MRTLKGCVYYYYQKLSDTERMAYHRFLEGFHSMEIEIPFLGRGFESMQGLLELIKADHPELFWIGTSGSMKQVGDKYFYVPNYSMSCYEKERRQGILERTVRCFVQNAGGLRTDVERLEKAYDYLVRNVDYDEDAVDSQNICSALIYHRSVCAGYARALQYLLQRMGIECIYVSGTTKNKGNHGWNIVKLGGDYYHTDVTFGVRSFLKGTSKRNGLPEALKAEYAYLCMNDDEALRDRRIRIQGGIRLPPCNCKDMSWYKRHNQYFSSADEAWRWIAKKLAEGQSYWACQFATLSAFNKFTNDTDAGRFASLAMHQMNLSRVSTSTSQDETMRYVVGWVREFNDPRKIA